MLCVTSCTSYVLYAYLYCVYGMRKKKLPLPFNETERNGPFKETERAVHDPFEVRAYFPSVLNPF